MWRLRQPSVTYVGVTVCLCLLVVLGTWLPWVENTPQYLDGEPYVTLPDLAGQERGFDTAFDLLVLVGLTPAVVGILAFQRWKRLRDVCVFLSGVLICWWVGGLLYEYWRVDHYLLEPGIAVVLVSGVLLCLVSAGTAANRLARRIRAE